MDKVLAIEENGAEFLMAFGRAARAEVRDEAGLPEWAASFEPGFGIGPVETRWIEGILRRLGFGGRGVTTSGGWPVSLLPRPRRFSRQGSPASTAFPPSSLPEGRASGPP